MSRLIHLNGPPGVGKSSLSRRYGVDHPGTWLCEIDVLRTMVSGWQDDFHGAGARVRTAALAAITSYLASGHDVVLPQLVGRADELARFRAAAAEGNGEYVGVVVNAAPATVIERFRTRSTADGHEAWVRAVTDVVEGLGGDDVLTRSCRDLEVLADRERLLRVQSSDPETTYRRLLLALGETS